MITSLNNNSMIDRALQTKTASDNVRDRRRTDADTTDLMPLSKTTFSYVQIAAIKTDSKYRCLCRLRRRLRRQCRCPTNIY